MREVIDYYDYLIDEGNDPVYDSAPLREYMDKWDGQSFIDKMQLDNTKSVFEIGVGTGRLAVRIAHLCRSFTGIDFSQKTIKKARINIPLSNVNLICDDFLSYKFESKFDVIYSSLTFMHIENKIGAISKVADLLNDNGRFILSIDKNRDAFINYGSRTIKIYPDDPAEIPQYMNSAGLIIYEMYETEHAYIFSAGKG